MNKTQLYIVVLMLLTASCVTMNSLHPSQKDMPKAEKRVPGINFADLNEGYKLYVKKCSACHRLYLPDEFEMSAWNIKLPEMYTRANIIDAKEQQMIKNYLLAKSR